MWSNQQLLSGSQERKICQYCWGQRKVDKSLTCCVQTFHTLKTQIAVSDWQDIKENDLLPKSSSLNLMLTQNFQVFWFEISLTKRPQWARSWVNLLSLFLVKYTSGLINGPFPCHFPSFIDHLFLKEFLD